MRVEVSIAMSLPRGHDTTAGRPPSTEAHEALPGGDEHRKLSRFSAGLDGVDPQSGSTERG